MHSWKKIYIHTDRNTHTRIDTHANIYIHTNTKKHTHLGRKVHSNIHTQRTNTCMYKDASINKHTERHTHMEIHSDLLLRMNIYMIA